MAESAAASNAAMLNLLAALPKTLFGSSTSKTSSGGAITEQTVFSKEAIDSLLRGIMEGTAGGVGFAQIAAGQKAPGLYNSTVRNMLMNDYATRAAAQVAEKTTPKTTSRTASTEITKIPGLMGKGTGLALGAGALLMNKKARAKMEELFKDITGTGGINPEGVLDFKDIASAYNPSNFPTSMPDSGMGLDLFSPTAFDAFNSFDVDIGGITSGADNVSALMGGADSFMSMGDAFGNVSTAADWTSGFDLADGASAIDGGFGTAGLGQLIQGDVGQAGVQAGMAAIPVIGPVLTGIDAVTGGAISEGPGGVVNEGLGFVEDMLGFGGSKVICTELCRQGKMSKHLYMAEATANLKRLSATTLRGYHAIAVPVVEKMRKSESLSNFLLPWVLDYSNEVLGYGSGIRGKFVRYILEPVCFLVGLVVPEQDYKSLYTKVA